MNREEKIEKLCLKTGVTREDAECALHACNDDILDAVLYLETLGKISHPQGGSYTTDTSFSEDVTKTTPKEKSAIARLFAWIGDIIKAGNENYIDVLKNDENFISLPLTVFVILLIPFFWLIAVLLVVGLFFDFHYHFRGPAFAEDGKTNQTMAQASKICADIKNDFKKDNCDDANGTEPSDHIE